MGVDVSMVLKDQHLALRLQRFFEQKVYYFPYLLLANVFSFNVLSPEETKILIPSIQGKIDDKQIRQNTMNLLSLMSSN
jgi:hypothetical protein